MVQEKVRGRCTELIGSSHSLTDDDDSENYLEDERAHDRDSRREVHGEVAEKVDERCATLHGRGRG